MKQLTVEGILNFINCLRERGLTEEQIKNIPVYLGNDDDLNGIHTSWFVNSVDPDDVDCEGFIALINEDRNNIPVKGLSILIS